MENVKGAPCLRYPAWSGKQSFLPPKSPSPVMPPGYANHGSTSGMGNRGNSKSRDGLRQHQRTSSESYLLEEQPSWLDDLLNEPETPVKKTTHRRSSSDSFAYSDISQFISNIDNPVNDDFKNQSLTSAASWGSQEFDHYIDLQYGSHHVEAYNYDRQHNKGWEPTWNARNQHNNMLVGDKLRQRSLASPAADATKSSGSEKQGHEDCVSHEQRTSSERKEGTTIKHSPPEADQKRAKQQFAQRSRVRKLQYIAELERTIQALQSEGSEVAAELQFLDQQNLILNLENNALKQRLDSLAQEQLIKHFQQEMLEREIARLRVLCQQQQHQQQLPASAHSRSSSRDLDSQFSKLSLKHKDANSGHDSVSGPLRI